MTLLADIRMRNQKTFLHDKLFVVMLGALAAISFTAANTAACIALLHG